MENQNDQQHKPLAVFIFLLGIALLFVSFYLAYQLFSVTPSKLLGLQANQPVDLNKIAPEAIKILLSLFYKTLMLLIMVFTGSIIAHKGISLYKAPKSK